MDSSRAQWPTIRKSHVDTTRLTVTSILSYPVRDLEGEYIHPDGLDFSRHRADPVIDLEHGRPAQVYRHLRADVGGLPVAWATPTFTPDGPYSVTYKSLDIDGTAHSLPVGVSHFDPSDRISAQVFALCAHDVLPGVSLEFVRPDRRFMKSLGRNALDPRKEAFEYTRAHVVRWTHCTVPINPGALTVTKSLPGSRQVPDALAKVLTDRRVAGEALLPVVYKALAHHLPPATRTTVRVEKAMPMPMPMPKPDDTDDTDDEFDAQSAYDADPEAADATGDAAAADPNADPNAPAGDAAPARPTVQAHYSAVQAIMDAVASAKKLLEGGEHVKGKKALEKDFARLEAICEDIKARGDAIDAELDGRDDTAGGDEEGDDEEGDDEEGDDEAAAEGDDTESAEGADAEEGDEGADDEKPFEKKAVALPPPLRFDADGVLETPKRVYKALLVKRFRMADLTADAPAAPAAPAVAKAAPAAAPDDDREETTAEAYARLEREDPDGFAELAAEHARLRKIRSWAS